MQNSKNRNKPLWLKLLLEDIRRYPVSFRRFQIHRGQVEPFSLIMQQEDHCGVATRFERGWQRMAAAHCASTYLTVSCMGSRVCQGCALTLVMGSAANVSIDF
jgi:hypothetical protein